MPPDRIKIPEMLRELTFTVSENNKVRVPWLTSRPYCISWGKVVSGM